MAFYLLITLEKYYPFQIFLDALHNIFQDFKLYTTLLCYVPKVIENRFRAIVFIEEYLDIVRLN